MVELTQEGDRKGRGIDSESRVPGSMRDGKSDQQGCFRNKTSTIRFIPGYCEDAVQEGWENKISLIFHFMQSLDLPPDGGTHDDSKGNISAIHLPNAHAV